MRNTKARVLAVTLRAREMEAQKRARRGRMLTLASLTLSFALIAGLSFLMPGVMAAISDCEYRNFGAAASIFDGSHVFGFVLIGVLAFALGVSVTILSYKLKLNNQLDQEAKEDGEETDD